MKKDKTNSLAWFRDNIQALKPYVPGFQPPREGFLKLNTNENPYPPSPRVARLLRELEVDTLRLYPDPHSDRLRDKIGEVYGFPRDQIIVGNGSDELLSIALRCFIGEGDRVVFPDPSYSLFEVLTRIQGARLVSVDLNEDFTLPENFITTQGKLKMMASPNSPTGTVYPLDVIDRVLEASEGIVLVDEAYADFSDETCLPLVPKYPHLIVVRTFSKAFGLAGVRIGYAFAPEEIIAGMMKVKDSYNLNRLSALAAEASLTDWDYFQENTAKIRREREYLERELKELGFFVYPSGANFLFARPSRMEARKIYQALQERGILIRYFDAPRLADCVRITVGTHEQMESVVAALKEILSQ